METQQQVKELNTHLDEKIDKYQDLANAVTSLPNDLVARYPEVNEYTLFILNILIEDILKRTGSKTW